MHVAIMVAMLAISVVIMRVIMFVHGIVGVVFHRLHFTHLRARAHREECKRTRQECSRYKCSPSKRRAWRA
jgi:hypothetical protein